MAIDKAVDSGALDTLFENIGNAIREKDGTTALITPGNMPAKIRAIQKTAGAEPPEKYAAQVEQAKAIYGGSYEAVLIQETVGQVNIGFLTKAFAVESYQPFSTEFRAKGWYQVRFDKADTAATPSAQDWRESPSQGGDYGSTIRFCGQKILYGTQQIYPRTYNIGDGMGAANGDGSYLGIFIGKPDNPGAVPNKHIVIRPAEIFFGEPETATEN